MFTLRNLLTGLLGLAVGALFLWLALREVRPEELHHALTALDGGLLAAAAGLYWIALGLRVLRWQLLLRELAPAPLGKVGETLVLGYAVNNVLPARLGEVARAAYAKRRLRIGRARVFGSIVIERVLDLVAIMSCLMVGLVALNLFDGGARVPTFEMVALNAGAVVGVAVLAIAALRSGTIERITLPRTLGIIVNDFIAGIATLNRRSLLLALLLSGGVWAFEVAALAMVFAAVGVELSVSQALLVMGAASLSTLVPTAPGYLGTYQLVAVIAMDAFGLPRPAGIVAATAIQAVLFGSVTVAGFAIAVVRLGRRALRASAQSSSENGVKSVPSS
ncbi:MAG: lysylphosphatidylglycerol synthase transmembrane domain-containing protein [Gammaproteobacteria bacterium]